MDKRRIPGGKQRREALVDWIGLSMVAGLGLRSFWRLYKEIGEPTKILDAGPQVLQNACRQIRPQFTSPVDSRAIRHQGAHQLDQLEARGSSVICYPDPQYPPLLRQLADPPPVLYLHGNIHLLSKPSVAIVGSRAATGYGKNTARRLAAALAQAGVVVTSGLALGIDGAAHHGALQGGGGTIGVLGCGLDVVYPRANNDLYRQLAQQGLLVSEYPLGIQPEGFRFPARNRIIAGLCRGIVVVEAARRSGSLITAQIGVDYGREVFAVPGQVDSCKSEGTHWLLQQGAKLVMGVEDVLEELTLAGTAVAKEPVTPPPGDEPTQYPMDADTVLLLQHLESYPQDREELLARIGLPASRVSELLLFLELEGMVEILPGDRVRKVHDQ